MANAETVTNDAPAAGTGAVTEPAPTNAPDDGVEVVTHDTADGADEGDAEGNDGDDKADKPDESSTDKETDPADGADEGTDGDDDEGDDDADELDDDELEALDAKARRKLGKVQRENANLRTRLKDAEARADKVEVALAAGLNPEAVKFLNGTTRDELEENAEALLVMLGCNGRVTPSGGPTELGSNPRRGDIDPAAAATRETDLNAIGARMYTR